MDFKIYFLFLIIIFSSCHSNTIITRQDQIKVLEITILEAQKDNFLFNEKTKYEIKFLNWYQYLNRCDKLQLFKDCKKDMNHDWDIFYKYKLRKKSNNFWFVRIYNDKNQKSKFKTIKFNPKYFYTFFIDPKTNRILLKFHDMNYKYK